MDQNTSSFNDDLITCIPHLRRYARGLTRNATMADDLVQDCLLRALAKQHLWQPGTSLKAWLFRILHNLWISELRRSRVVNIVYADDYRSDASIAPGQDNSLLVKELEKHLHQLSDLYREVLMLVCVEGCSYEETAAILDLPIGTVRSRLARARDQLHERMNTSNEGPVESRRQLRRQEKATRVA